MCRFPNRPLYDVKAVQPNSEVRSSTFGVVKFTLHRGNYEWEFVPIPGETFRDFGTGQCH